MSRNDLFFIIACAIVATVLSGSPMPLTRSPTLTIASLISPDAMDGMGLDKALYQQSFDHQ